MRWWLEKFKKALQVVLGWVDRTLNRSPRAEASSLLAREIHVPTPVVTIGTAIILFALLVPHVGFDLKKILVLAGLVVLLTAFFVLYFIIDLPELVHDDEAVFLAGFCVIVGVAMVELSLLVPQYSHDAIPSGFPNYAVPLGAIAIVVSLLLNIRLALLISMILSIFCGVLNHFSFNAMIVAFFACSAAMFSAQKIRHRSDIMWAGFHIAWVTAVCVYGLSLFHDWPAAMTLKRMTWPVVNGVLCTAISLALLPVLEAFFSRVTPITLLEVGDFNRPLLRRLMLEAPGTYHHTLLVSAIAEQAAAAIGANSLLCRVGMYYHDVGKLVHPDYFIENQTLRHSVKDKPELHDKLNPSISSLVILSHVKDGVALVRSHKVPPEVAKFIPEHHGTSIIKYFYMQALEQDEDHSPPADAFRYPGPKPRSRETVIGMLADSVEAASRTMEEPTYDRLRGLIEKIVNSKFMDGQFDEAPVTLQDLRKIIDSFATSLSALYHVRIEYPEMTEKGSTLPFGSNPPPEVG